MLRYFSSFILLMGVLLSGCKPTPRTAPEARHPILPKTQEEESTPTPASPSVLQTAHSILVVRATRQEYKQLTPWEKHDASTATTLGIYLGDERVLVPARTVTAATYVEISLPDGSQTVPAMVIKMDREMNLALLAPLHEKDATIFESSLPLSLADTLDQGEPATFSGLIDGVKPTSIPLITESIKGSTIPQFCLRAAHPLPAGHGSGAPIIQEGKLVALSTSYHENKQLITAVDASFIARFLSHEDKGLPLLGLQLSLIDDPVFRHFLQLPEDVGGLYISKIAPCSAAAQAGIAQGDVLTQIESFPLDKQGRCRHPRYGVLEAAILLRALKPCGDVLNVSVYRNGTPISLQIPMNKDAEQNAIFRKEEPGVQPRHIMWGGMLFQPITANYLSEMRQKTQDSLPLAYQELDSREAELRERGYTELTALALVIPTAATRGYEDVQHCVVEAVNGKPALNFSSFAALITEQAPSGRVRLDINKPPYTIYLDQDTIQTSNELLKRTSFPKLFHLPSQAEHS
ncbi:MAG: hypothetical protein IKK45_06055 [Akkermansia sp.]|nr:hypothetical protein [Akkermansia sp.]